MLGLLMGVMSSGLMDSVELERTVANLNKDLSASGEAEEALRGQLAALQLLPDQLHNLMEQAGFLTFL